MKQVSVTELKNRLSHFLRLVKAGETIELLEHKVPVARLSAVEDITADALALRLQRDGLAATPSAKPYRRFLKTPPVPCSADAVRILIEERGDR